MEPVFTIWFRVVDNSIDEALAGYCNEINVTIHDEQVITVSDNGRTLYTCGLLPEGRNLPRKSL